MNESQGRDSGAATLWVLMAMLVLIVATGAAVATGTAIRMRHRAAAAADAAALAGALDASLGPTAACAAAGRVAGSNGASLVSCAVDRRGTTVVTGVGPPGWLAWLGAARGRARAGQIPAEAAEPP